MSTGTGVRAHSRARIAARTLRTDRWWIQPTVTVVALALFIVYATYRAFSGEHYFAEPYLSPFYSPCITDACVDGSSHLGVWVRDWWPLSPAVLILVLPLSLRFTCYYYRRAYYRSFWASPPACAVAEPHRRYTGETRFPLIIQNAHRLALYVAFAYNVLLGYDAALAFRSPEGEWGHAGLGTVILVVNAVLLALYSVSCHSCRHMVGGRLRNFSRNPVRYRAWTMVTRLNARHSMFAWVSLGWVAFTDFYVWMVASGTFTDPRIF
jgi:hypothetical protein